MFRIFHVHLTVLGILLCPFACAGRADETNARGTGELRSRSACACCPHREGSRDEKPSPNGQNGRGSRPDCNCTCLCKGALTGNQDVRAGLPIDIFNLAFVPPVVFSKTSHTEAVLSWLSGGPPSSYPVGRAARLVLQSLLC